jgi:hypothetical protein
MAFDVTNTFQAGTDAKASELNKNFSDIEDELNAFPTAGALKEGSVTESAIANSAITVAKLSNVITDTSLTGASNSNIPSTLAVKTYLDNKFDTLEVFGSAQMTSTFSSTSGTDDWSDSIWTCPANGTYQIYTAARFLMKRYTTLRIGWHQTVGGIESYQYENYYNTAYTTSNVNYGWGLVKSGTVALTAGDTIKLYARANGGSGGTCYAGAPICIMRSGA